MVDNGSSDNSLDRVRSGPDLRVLRLHGNVGFAKANNIGIRESSGRYVVLLNSDTVVTPSWLDKLLVAAEDSLKIGIVAPKLLRRETTPVLDSTGHTYQYQTGLAIDRGSGQLDMGQYDGSTELTSCCFACALVKRVVFRNVGLLDEKLFFYFEDVDYSLRARIAGWRIVYCPVSVVYHARGGSTLPIQREWVRNRSRPYPLRIILKNYQTKNMLRYGGRWLLLDLLRVVSGLLNLNFKYARAYAQEIQWTFAHLPLRERIASQRLRKIPDRLVFPHTRV